MHQSELDITDAFEPSESKQNQIDSAITNMVKGSASMILGNAISGAFNGIVGNVGGGLIGGVCSGALMSVIGGSELTDTTFEGGSSNKSKIVTYAIDRGEVPKDAVIASLIPEGVSECEIATGVGPGKSCVTQHTTKVLAKKYDLEGDPDAIMEGAKKATKCSSQACVLSHLDAEISLREWPRLRIKGPTDNALLSNFDVDNKLRQWSAKWPGFFPYNFNMLNYRDYSFVCSEGSNRGNSGSGNDTQCSVKKSPDTLYTIKFDDLKSYTHAGCVINTDTYQGQGKHWMALFLDIPGGSIEFFNSSANPPQAEFADWLIRMKDQASAAGVKLNINNVCRIRHQHSRTECGVYSLFYIYARLNGVPFDYFLKTPVRDQHMFEFRQHLYTSATQSAYIENNVMPVFSWNAYKKVVSLKWE